VYEENYKFPLFYAGLSSVEQLFAKRRKSSEEAWSVLEMLQREERAVKRHGLCWKCCKEKKEQ
jgi:hypothetical protein